MAVIYKCRVCSVRIRKARYETGRDYCTDPDCIRLCAKPFEVAAVGVAKSIPQFVPKETVTPTVARSGNRRV